MFSPKLLPKSLHNFIQILFFPIFFPPKIFAILFVLSDLGVFEWTPGEIRSIQSHQHCKHNHHHEPTLSSFPDLPPPPGGSNQYLPYNLIRINLCSFKFKISEALFTKFVPLQVEASRQAHPMRHPAVNSAFAMAAYV